MSDCGSVALSEDRLPPCDTIDPLCVTIYATNQSQPIERYTQAQPNRALAALRQHLRS